jgi:ectoine hydroxylase
VKLTKQQLEQFDREGYLFFPGQFTPTETRALTAAVPELYSRREAYNVREKGKDAVRTNFAAHMVSEPFAKLARHPRMVGPVMDLFNEQVYMHQFKINGKAAFEGDVWQWHQDYGTWLNDDMMPTERAMNVAIFLDDVNEHNGPLMFIPGSHKKGVVEAKHDLTTTSYPLWTVDNALIAQLVERAGGRGGFDAAGRYVPGGIVAPKGPAGSMILFHSCLVHASGSNLSPWHRVAVYLSLCTVSNHIRRFQRPEFIAHRDFTPIEMLPDDCLLKDYPVEVPWKDGVPASALQTSSVPFEQVKQVTAEVVIPAEAIP